MTIIIFFTPEAMPGNIRRAEHFLGFMRRFNEYLKVCCMVDGMSVSTRHCHVTRPDSESHM